MDLVRLSYFVTLANAGSFTRAARLLEITQPSLSQQIRKLELSVGQPLADRLPRGVVLTAHGQRLLEHAKPLLQQYERMQSLLRDQPDTPAGPLAIGAIPTIAPYLLPGVLKRFTHDYPDVTVTLHEDVTANLVRQLEEGVLDVAIISTLSPRATIHQETLYEEPLLAVVNKRHRLAKRQRVTLASIKDDRLLLLHEMHCLSQQVAQLCFTKSSRRSVAMRGESLTTVGELIDVGLGVSIVPQMMTRGRPTPHRVYLPFEEPLTRPIVLAMHLLRYRTSATRAFVDTLRQHKPA